MAGKLLAEEGGGRRSLVSRFVLIHGSFHGSWYWEKVVPLLERDGHEVAAPDLPGHNEDHTPVAQISLRS
jgi:pimeloyl-ACP methyl ester carboxylesterase